MSGETEGPPAPPVLDRKISTFSETDSGVEVDNDTEEPVETSLEKRVIKPDLDIISKLCNFDEEEEEEEQDMTESENDSSDEESSSSERSSRVRLTLLELSHILSALVKQHTEVTARTHDSVLCSHFSIWELSVSDTRTDTGRMC